MARLTSARRRSRAPIVVLGLVAAFYTVAFLIPLVLMAGVSIGKGGLLRAGGDMQWWQSYTDLWGSSYYREIIWQSLMLAIATVVVTLALGLPLAYTAVNGSYLMRVLVLVAVLNPLFVSVIIRSFGLKVLFQYFGRGPSWFLVLVGTVQVLLPFMVLPLLDGMRSLDTMTILAARSLGARRLRVAYRVVFPVLLPSIMAGAALVFVISMNIFSIPLVLGRPQEPTLALVIYQSAIVHGNFRFAAAGGVSLLFLTLVGMFVLSRARGRVNLV